MFETQNASHPPAKQGMKASDIQECFHPSIQARMGWPHPSLCGEAVLAQGRNLTSIIGAIS